MTFIVEGVQRTRGLEGQVHRIGEYEKLEDAVIASKRSINEFLLRAFVDGMSAGTLFSYYKDLGEVPFIFRDDNNTINVGGFNHLEYTRLRCAEICAGK